MRKLIVLGILLTMTTGCGRGWFPHLFRGAPCNGLCSTPAAVQHNCEGCSGYGAYEGEVAAGSYVDGVGSAIPGTYETVTQPPMTNMPGSSNPLPPGTITTPR